VIENSGCCPGEGIIGGTDPVLERPVWSSATFTAESLGGITAPRLSCCLPLAERKEQREMKWIKKLWELGRERNLKPTAEAEARKEALRIEELEARLAPNALWGE
jgi:hypothetical protein